VDEKLKNFKKDFEGLPDEPEINKMKFFTDNINAPISGIDAKHIKNSLRLRSGDIITVSSDNVDYKCKITQISNDVAFEIISSEPCSSEPSLRLTLYQALPKGDKMDLIIQKCVELGVTEIVPVITDRCVPKIGDFSKKIERYNRISLEAAKQSGRGIVPEVKNLLQFKKALQNLSESAIILYEEKIDGKRFDDLTFNGNLSVFIGSEGGFTPEEVRLATENNVAPVWLGKRILRCETAAITATSVIMYKSGNL
jgi:16S rRNA (uracil1498-N3)-methyltransferase